MARKVSLHDRQNKAPKASTLVLKSFTTDNELNNNTEEETNAITNNVIKNETKDTSNIDIKVEAKDTTKENTEFVTKNETENNEKKKSKTSKTSEGHGVASLQYIKKIKIGTTVIEGKFYSGEELKRSAYHLRTDTINKIERCKKYAGGLKKAELVDLILNDALSKILNKLETE